MITKSRQVAARRLGGCSLSYAMRRKGGDPLLIGDQPAPKAERGTVVTSLGDSITVGAPPAVPERLSRIAPLAGELVDHPVD